MNRDVSVIGVKVTTDHGIEGIVAAQVYVGDNLFTRKSKHKRRDLWERRAIKMCKDLGLDRYELVTYGRWANDDFPDYKHEIILVKRG